MTFELIACCPSLRFLLSRELSVWTAWISFWIQSLLVDLRKQKSVEKNKNYAKRLCVQVVCNILYKWSPMPTIKSPESLQKCNEWIASWITIILKMLVRERKFSKKWNSTWSIGFFHSKFVLFRLNFPLQQDSASDSHWSMISYRNDHFPVNDQIVLQNTNFL